MLLYHDQDVPKKLAIANQKGGTGKTTTAVNLCAALTRRGKRTLLVDLDPQGNATAVFLGAEFTLKNSLQPTIYEVLIGESTATSTIQQIELESNKHHPAATIDLLPAHVRLARATIELPSKPHREHILTHALKPIEHHYDHIIFDCPPALGLLTINALMAARQIIIPVEPGYFSLMGIGLLQQTIRDVISVNRGLRLLGVLPTLIDRTVEARDTINTLKEMFNGKTLPSIPRRVAVRESHSSGLDIFGYAPTSAAAEAYMALAEEVIRG